MTLVIVAVACSLIGIMAITHPAVAFIGLKSLLSARSNKIRGPYGWGAAKFLTRN